jgi:hypothetical protein
VAAPEDAAASAPPTSVGGGSGTFGRGALACALLGGVCAARAAGGTLDTSEVSAGSASCVAATRFACVRVAATAGAVPGSGAVGSSTRCGAEGLGFAPTALGAALAADEAILPEGDAAARSVTAAATAAAAGAASRTADAVIAVASSTAATAVPVAVSAAPVAVEALVSAVFAAVAAVAAAAFVTSVTAVAAAVVAAVAVDAPVEIGAGAKASGADTGGDGRPTVGAAPRARCAPTSATTIAIVTTALRRTPGLRAIED